MAGGSCSNCGSALAADARFCAACGEPVTPSMAGAQPSWVMEPGQVVGGYRIESLIARGGMGVVYRAEQIALERTVALKVIAPEFAEDVAFQARFQREARLAARLNHPNIVSVHEAGTADGRLFMAMAFVEGHDLGAVLATDGPLDPARAADLFAQVARALDAAHAAGLVHRDIKPGNILVSNGRDGEHAYLGDFGLTKDAGSTSGVTRTGEWVGTVDYVAPEQIENGAIDARTDIYSLGCLLYQALSGRIPFEGSGMATMYAHVNTPPPVLSGAPEAINAVVQRAMAKDPEDRFPSAGDLGRAFGAAVRGEEVTRQEQSVAKGTAATGAPTRTVSAGPPIAASTRIDQPAAGAAQPPSKRRSGRPFAIAAGVLVALAVAGGGVVLASRSSEGDEAKPVAAEPAAKQRTKPKASVAEAPRRSEPPPTTTSTPAAPARISYTSYTPPGYGWTAELPSGAGWSSPQNSEPVADRRYTTTLNGPEGVIVSIDYTPFDVPTFGEGSISQRTVPQPNFGSAKEYISSTADHPACQPKCVDYLVDDGQGGGYGVIAGGGNFETARTVARHIMSTLSYNDE